MMYHTAREGLHRDKLSFGKKADIMTDSLYNILLRLVRVHESLPQERLTHDVSVEYVTDNRGLHAQEMPTHELVAQRNSFHQLIKKEV